MPIKKFRFRLEKVLQLKSHLEAEKQKELALSTQKVLHQVHAINEIDRVRGECCDKERRHLTGNVDPIHLLTFSRYFLQLKKNELKGRMVLKGLKGEEEKRRLDLVAATRQRKIYEKLKERRHQAYQKESALIEQKEQDEMAAQSFMKKKASGQ